MLMSTHFNKLELLGESGEMGGGVPLVPVVAVVRVEAGVPLDARTRRVVLAVIPGGWLGYRGTSLIRNSLPRGPYSRSVPRALRWS